MVAVAITRTELTAADLRGAAARAKDADAVRRMLALALVLEGHPRAEAAEACGMDRQTLRLEACLQRVHRYNAEGLAGLSDRRPPGRKPHLTPAQQAEVAGWVERGPELETDGVVRWRRVDLRARIERAFAVRLHPATVGKLLRKLRFRRLSVRPQHPRSDPAEQEAFRGASPSGRRPSCPRPRRASRSRSGSPTKPELVSRAR
jgi:transposase